MFRIQKRTVAFWLVCFSFFLVVFSSAPVWFLLPIQSYYMPVASLPIAIALLLSTRLKSPLFSRTDYLWPTLSIGMLLLVMAISSGRNVNGFFMVAFSVLVYSALFRLNLVDLRRLSDFLTYALACILIVSIPFYFFYLFGGNLPHFRFVFGLYTFDNYYFFLVDDRFNLQLIPRFCSVFIEPAQLGMTCVTLLFPQAGKWHTLRCRILFLALLMSFSLAAYACLVFMLFAVAWMKGKAVLGKIILLGTIVLSIGVTAMFYNRGDNLVNQLIVSRVMLDENGEMEGNNRATGLFVKEYDKFIASGEVLFGRGHESLEKFGFGNAGYRVYIYCYGLISVVFLLLMFWTLARTSTNRRACVSMLLLHALSFWAHGIPHRPMILIPLYILMFSTVTPLSYQMKQNKCKPLTVS